MLTARQREALAFITEAIDRTGLAPSFDEIRAGLGLPSRSAVHRVVVALEERGFIRRLPGRARALEVIRRLDGPATADLAERLQQAEKLIAAFLATTDPGRIPDVLSFFLVEVDPVRKPGLTLHAVRRQALTFDWLGAGFTQSDFYDAARAELAAGVAAL